MEIGDVLQRLERVRRSGDEWVALCPAHNDEHPSLSVSEGANGKILLHCHTGCTFEKVRGALGLSRADVSPNLHPSALRRDPEARHDRERPPPLDDATVSAWSAALRADTDAMRHAVEVLKFSPEVVDREHLGLVKVNGRRWLAYPYRHQGTWTFANLRSLDEEKAFRREPFGQKTTLYRADSLEHEGVALLVEGERDAIAALSMGLDEALGPGTRVAIVAIPGASHTRMAVEALSGQRRVYVATDADEAGDEAAAVLIRDLGKARAVRVRPPGVKDLGDLLSALGSERGRDQALGAILSAVPGTSPAPAYAATADIRVSRFSPDELRSEPTPVRFLWEGFVPAKKVTVLAAKGGGGKTTLGVGLAISRASGEPYLGRSTAEGETVIVTLEDDRADYQRKIKAWDAVRPLDVEKVAPRVHLVDLTGQRFSLVESAYGKAEPGEQVERLAEAIRASAPNADLIILETASRLGAGGESNGEMSALVAAAERLVKQTDAAVLLVSHVSKAAAREGISDAHAARGGSAIADNARAVLTLGPDPDSVKKRGDDGEGKARLLLKLAKANFAPPQPPIFLERVSTPWGLALRHLDAAEMAAVAAEQAAEKNILMQKIQHVVTRSVHRSETVTRNLIREKYSAEIGVPKGKVRQAVAEAIAGGYIAEGATARGGGCRLVPGELAWNSFPANSPMLAGTNGNPGCEF